MPLKRSCRLCFNRRKKISRSTLNALMILHNQKDRNMFLACYPESGSTVPQESPRNCIEKATRLFTCSPYHDFSLNPRHCLEFLVKPGSLGYLCQRFDSFSFRAVTRRTRLGSNREPRYKCRRLQLSTAFYRPY